MPKRGPQHHVCSGRCAPAVARKANATVEEMQAAVSMQLLEVLLILTRSQSNRQRLLSLGLLTALAHSMKVSYSARASVVQATMPLRLPKPRMERLLSKQNRCSP